MSPPSCSQRGRAGVLGTAKALLRGADGIPWVERAARRLISAGCGPVVVVVGARAAEVAALVPPSVVPPLDVVEAAGWAEGMGASLRAGLVALSARRPLPDAVLVALVDTPGMTTDVVRRVAAAGGRAVGARTGGVRRRDRAPCAPRP